MTSNKYSAQIIQRNKSWQACFQCVCSMLLLAPPARMVWGSLNANSVATLVHTFVTLHVDYSNAILAGASKSITDKLQRVLNAAAHTVGDTCKYDRGLSHLLHEELELHWLDVTQWAQYKCPLMSAVQSSAVHDGMLHSALRHYLSAASEVFQLPPAVCTLTPAFNVRSPDLPCGWPDGLELVTWYCSWPNTFIWQFLAWFKTFLFSVYSRIQHTRGFGTTCDINSRPTLTFSSTTEWITNSE